MQIVVCEREGGSFFMSNGYVIARKDIVRLVSGYRNLGS